MASLILPKISETVNGFMKEREASHRFASFDYCYNHFHYSNPKRKRDLEKSCMALFSYLGSWGMLRGSGDLGQEKNIKCFVPMVEYIYRCKRSCWDIDVDNYEENMETILDIAETIQDYIEKGMDVSATAMLLTKVLFGVFGFVPAFDLQFQNTMFQVGTGKVNYFRDSSESFNRNLFSKKLNWIGEIYAYKPNRRKIDAIYEAKDRFKTLVFQDGESIRYTRAKIIDMYGFYRNKSFAER